MRPVMGECAANRRSVSAGAIPGAVALARAGALLGILGATAVCSGGKGHPFPVAPTTAAPEDEMTRAIARYEESGDPSAVEAFIAAHPDDERSEVWHELLALQAYDAAFELGQESEQDYDPAPVVSSGKLRKVMGQYPGTFAASMAMAGLDTESRVLESAALQTLSRPAINPRIVEFLDGRDAWVAEVDTEVEGVQIDIRRFRRRHEQGLRDTFKRELVAAGCKDNLGYCNWYIERFPSDDGVRELQAAVKKVWYQRAHPPWRGKAHLQCAYDCSNACRDAATPLDDSCFDPCYARCG